MMKEIKKNYYLTKKQEERFNILAREKKELIIKKP